MTSNKNLHLKGREDNQVALIMLFIIFGTFLSGIIFYRVGWELSLSALFIFALFLLLINKFYKPNVYYEIIETTDFLKLTRKNSFNGKTSEKVIHFKNITDLYISIGGYITIKESLFDKTKLSFIDSDKSGVSLVYEIIDGPDELIDIQKQWQEEIKKPCFKRGEVPDIREAYLKHLRRERKD